MKADLHVHSTASPDGLLEPREILRVLRSRGFGAVAILDHNSMRGSLEALELAGDLGMIVVRGMEISSADGHLGAIGICEEIPRGLPAEVTVERIHDLGGLAIALHPFRWSSGLGPAAVRSCSFDAVEVLNGRTSPSGNRRAQKLCASLGLPRTAGSDAHFDYELGKAYLTFDGCESEEELLDVLKKGEGTASGYGRSIPDSVRYAKKTLTEWVRRVFSRL